MQRFALVALTIWSTAGCGSAASPWNGEVADQGDFGGADLNQLNRDLGAPPSDGSEEAGPDLSQSAADLAGVVEMGISLDLTIRADQAPLSDGGAPGDLIGSLDLFARPDMVPP